MLRLDFIAVFDLYTLKLPMRLAWLLSVTLLSRIGRIITELLTDLSFEPLRLETDLV